MEACPKRSGYLEQVRASFELESRERMAQVVEPLEWQTGLGERPLQLTGHVPWVERPAGAHGEHAGRCADRGPGARPTRLSSDWSATRLTHGPISRESGKA
jgi:hypothetical protein